MESSESQPGIVTVSPIVPVIEVDEEDELGEVWKTNWIEYDDLQPSWRIILFAVQKKDGQLEWALIKQEENGPSVECILHMAGEPCTWDKVVDMAREFVLSVCPEDHELILRQSDWSDSYGIRWTGGLDDAPKDR